MQDLTREQLEGLTSRGRVWDTKELQEDFEVRQFAAPFVVVKRKSDGVIGSLEFQHQPRLYFDFEPTQEKVSN
tara:strand:- start:5078 stop:5296 length:219 start_codon:yes stop_codon:yes gene_type:complete